MNPNDDEYQLEYDYVFDSDENVTHLIRVGLNTESGQLTQFMVQYEIEFLDGQRHAIVRFDNRHDPPHRHLPGLPIPSRDRIPISTAVPPEHMVSYAIEQIETNYLAWLRSANEAPLTVEDTSDDRN